MNYKFMAWIGMVARLPHYKQIMLWKQFIGLGITNLRKQEDYEGNSAM